MSHAPRRQRQTQIPPRYDYFVVNHSRRVIHGRGLAYHACIAMRLIMNHLWRYGPTVEGMLMLWGVYSVSCYFGGVG